MSANKRIIMVAISIILMMTMLTGCGWWRRLTVDFKSDIANGLYRTVTIYTADGDVIAKYTGKIDIEANDGGYVKFDLNGKRYIYYNCFVESIGDIP